MILYKVKRPLSIAVWVVGSRRGWGGLLLLVNKFLCSSFETVLHISIEPLAVMLETNPVNIY